MQCSLHPKLNHHAVNKILNVIMVTLEYQGDQNGWRGHSPVFKMMKMSPGILNLNWIVSSLFCRTAKGFSEVFTINRSLNNAKFPHLNGHLIYCVIRQPKSHSLLRHLKIA